MIRTTWRWITVHYYDNIWTQSWLQGAVDEKFVPMRHMIVLEAILMQKVRLVVTTPSLIAMSMSGRDSCNSRTTSLLNFLKFHVAANRWTFQTGICAQSCLQLYCKLLINYKRMQMKPPRSWLSPPCPNFLPITIGHVHAERLSGARSLCRPRRTFCLIGFAGPKQPDRRGPSH